MKEWFGVLLLMQMVIAPSGGGETGEGDGILRWQILGQVGDDCAVFENPPQQPRVERLS